MSRTIVPRLFVNSQNVNQCLLHDLYKGKKGKRLGCTHLTLALYAMTTRLKAMTGSSETIGNPYEQP